MHTQAIKKGKNTRQSAAHAIAQLYNNSPSLQFEDNRPEAIAQRRLRALINKGQAELISPAEKTVQRMKNNTGLPDDLKTGIENLSGYSMHDVKVHYNSYEPAQLNAHAYAQGTDIHIGPGQEKHLPHEAWHVVQQKQGRVKPTLQMKESVAINDDAALEKEADVMGNKAMTVPDQEPVEMNAGSIDAGLIQRKIMIGDVEYNVNESDNDQIALAVGDEFIRYYDNEAEMRDHMAGLPSNVGLIRKRALWYRMPYLPNEFFVFGESHSGVRGSDIKEASNIVKPILNEAKAGWNVDDYDKENNAPQDQDQKDQGVDENSSKLLRALEVLDPLTLLTPETIDEPQPVVDEIPGIPQGEKSTRKKSDGSYRLVIKDEDGKEKWWTEPGETTPPANDYNSNQEALDAVLELFDSVFGDKNNKEKLNVELYRWSRKLGRGKLQKAWEALFKRTWENHPKDMQIEILEDLKDTLIQGTKAKVEADYWKFKKNSTVRNKIRNPNGLESADSYRNEYMFAAILKAATSDNFAFAAIGNYHLEELALRLDGENIKYITKDYFYEGCCLDAV